MVDIVRNAERNGGAGRKKRDVVVQNLIKYQRPKRQRVLESVTPYRYKYIMVVAGLIRLGFSSSATED